MICGAYDMGRLLGEAIARSRHLTRAGLKEGLERVKRVPAAMGVDGTWMGFGLWDRAALKGEFLVFREWKDGQSVQVVRPLRDPRPRDGRATCDRCAGRWARNPRRVSKMAARRPWRGGIMRDRAIADAEGIVVGSQRGQSSLAVLAGPPAAHRATAERGAGRQRVRAPSSRASSRPPRRRQPTGPIRRTPAQRAVAYTFRVERVLHGAVGDRSWSSRRRLGRLRAPW